MTPLNQAVTELTLAVEQAERRAEAYLDEGPEVMTSPDALGRLHDHRVAVAGDMADALDRVLPGLGQRFMQALYPEVDLSFDLAEFVSGEEAKPQQGVQGQQGQQGQQGLLQ